MSYCILAINPIFTVPCNPTESVYVILACISAAEHSHLPSFTALSPCAALPHLLCLLKRCKADVCYFVCVCACVWGGVFFWRILLIIT